MERKLKDVFRMSFGMELILINNPDTGISLHCADHAKVSADDIKLDNNGVWNVPPLHQQGDGMRSFVGCMLMFLTSPGFVHLIDEPEAFLHPWHTRMSTGMYNEPGGVFMPSVIY